MFCLIPSEMVGENLKVNIFKKSEREGFEPSVINYIDVPSLYLKPLGHLSFKFQISFPRVTISPHG